MKFLAIPLIFLLAACAGKENIKIPNPPQNTQKEEVQVPVPVLCKAEVDRPSLAIETTKEGEQMEKQTAVLRQTVAQQKAYTVELEAAIKGCGGTIK